jgi:hypothetical protein
MSDDNTQDGAEPSPASAGSPPLRLFVCSRWSYDDPERSQSWYGALLILAVDEKSARDLFVKTEWNHEQPRMVELVAGVFGLGEARVIYDDDLRSR